MRTINALTVNDTMAIEIQNISIREYAKYLGVSDKTVRNAIAAGRIKKGVSYKMADRKGEQVAVPEINTAIADEEFGHLYQSGKIRPGQNKISVSEKLNSENFLSNENKSTQVPTAPQQPEDDIPIDEELDEEQIIGKLKITSKTTYAEATRIREVIGSVLDKMKLQEQKRILIKKDEVEKSLFDAGTEIKKKLLNIPARITSELRGAGTEVEAQKILTIEITEVLNEFAALVKID